MVDIGPVFIRLLQVVNSGTLKYMDYINYIRSYNYEKKDTKYLPNHFYTIAATYFK